jgi:hypothetical protein
MSSAGSYVRTICSSRVSPVDNPDIGTGSARVGLRDRDQTPVGRYVHVSICSGLSGKCNLSSCFILPAPLIRRYHSAPAGRPASDPLKVDQHVVLGDVKIAVAVRRTDLDLVGDMKGISRGLQCLWIEGLCEECRLPMEEKVSQDPRRPRWNPRRKLSPSLSSQALPKRWCDSRHQRTRRGTHSGDHPAETKGQ